MEEKKLYKSVKDRKISGVCAGLGDYLGIDATLIRLGWILGSLFTGCILGLIAYFVCSVVIPDAPAGQ